MLVSSISECRICKSQDLKNVISLYDQYITSRFPKYGDFSTPKTSILLCMCNHCGLIQLRHTTNSEELYEYEYGYRSGISNTMRTHLKSYQEEICSLVNLKEGDTIVDIGSNDSTMLQYYGNKLRRIGVDPTGKQFKQFYGEVELLPTYFTYENFTEAFGSIKCKMISSISMFYDLPDPVQFAKDIYQVLEEDGIWTCEQSYLLSMLRTNSVDTICHEHLEYYALHQVKEIADRSHFKIIDVKFNECNGGSFRIYFAKKECTLYQENTELIHTILKEEIDYGIMNMDGKVYYDFMTRCNEQIEYLKKFIDTVNENHKKVYVYGASTKGNCLLQYAKLNESHMKYAVERNLNKVGKMTSTGIEIISEETMRENPPDYLFVLPWHFKKEIVERERSFLENGGQFIFPFPNFEIMGSKPKMLITGCDGMIAHYVKEKFTDYNLYGISRTLTKHEKHITKMYFDLNDTYKLDDCLSWLKPDVVVHLAAISSSHYSLNHPTEAFKNGLVTTQLCEMIHKKGMNTRLFNASSSEIYKGHVDYEVTEDDNHMYHLHPYSISKIAGHSMVDFYRHTYGLPFSNGIIFTTESPFKRKEFLLNKVASHIKEWKNGATTPLRVGNLDSFRNMIHASDVADAIHRIIEQPTGDTYLICNDESRKVYDIVIQLYMLSGIKVNQTEYGWIETKSGLPILIIDEQLGRDVVPNNIRGEAKKLKGLGWKPTFSIEDMLSSIL